MKEAGPARGLFWEQLLRSNGLVRATLTFPSREEGRIGEGRGRGGGSQPRTPTGVEEKGASGLQEFSLGLGADTQEEFLLWKTGLGTPPPQPFHCAS